MTDQLTIEYRRLDAVAASRWRRNPKLHDIGAIVESIRRHGFIDPPGWDSTLNGGVGGLLYGNGRDEALEWMHAQGDKPPRGIQVDSDGMWLVPVKVGVDQVSEVEAEAAAIAHNNLSLSGGDFTPFDMARMWDASYTDILAGLATADALPITVDGDALDALLAGINQVEPGAGGDEFDPTPQDGLTRTQSGDLWQIGPHRLLVGDCTDPANVERLMGGERADVSLCDLPYGSTGCVWDAVIPFDELWGMYAEHTADDAAIVLTASQPFTSALIASRFDWFKHCWVWNKKLSGNFLLADRQPLKIHEDVCVFSRGNYTYSPQMWQGVKRLKGGNGRSKLWGMALTGNINDSYYPVSIIEIGNTDRTNIEHPTQKPVELFEYLLDTYSKSRDNVLDNAMGSGTTLIAAHRTGRRCYGMEISSKFADVILRRAEAEGLTCERITE